MYGIVHIPILATPKFKTGHQGTKQASTYRQCPGQSRPSHSAPVPTNVRFSNRPFGVKHFQTIHHYSVDVAHGLALLFGIGTKALPLWDSRTRWNNLWVGLAVRRTPGPRSPFSSRGAWRSASPRP